MFEILMHQVDLSCVMNSYPDDYFKISSISGTYSCVDKCFFDSFVRQRIILVSFQNAHNPVPFFLDPRCLIIRNLFISIIYVLIAWWSKSGLSQYVSSTIVIINNYNHNGWGVSHNVIAVSSSPTYGTCLCKWDGPSATSCLQVSWLVFKLLWVAVQCYVNHHHISEIFLKNYKTPMK